MPHRTAVLVLSKRRLNGLVECKEAQGFKTKSMEESLGNIGVIRIMNNLRFFPTPLTLASQIPEPNFAGLLCPTKPSLPWSSRSSLRQLWHPSLRLLLPSMPEAQLQSALFRDSVTSSLRSTTIIIYRCVRVFLELVEKAAALSCVD